MPFERPTLAQLIERTQADVESRLPGVEPRLRRSLAGALARAHAGAVHGLYGYLDWIADQVLPDTADEEQLARWASIWGVARKAASAAVGTLTAAGVNGTVIPAGTAWQRADGAEFTTDAEATIAAGTAALALTASEPGEAGNTAAGSTLSLVSPIAGITSEATTTAGLSGGAEVEGDADLLARLLARIRQPPHGGAGFDYVTWALEVAGVTRAWIVAEFYGAGTVGLFVVDDESDPIAPGAPKVAEVQAYVDERRPVTANVTVVAPTLDALALTIELTPDTAEIRAAVEAELADLLLREAEVEDGSGNGTILLSHLREAVSTAAGEVDHALTVPNADVTRAAGHMAVLGAITWV